MRQEIMVRLAFYDGFEAGRRPVVAAPHRATCLMLNGQTVAAGR
jgi:hypothetical protein